MAVEITTNEYGEEQVRVETKMKKCTACGANMVFDPNSQMLYCSHCGTKQSLPQFINAKEFDIRHAFGEGENWSAEETVVFRCNNCGAKVVMEKNETALSCPFCGTAHVQKTEEIAGIKPNALIPFTFDVARAIELGKKWARKKLYAPRKFKKNLSAENVNGVYAPCFTFDSYTTSYYKGRLGERYTVVVGSGKNARTVTRIRWFTVQGTYYDNFDDILITAGNKFGQEKLDKLSPYDTNNSREYCENFLLGFMAYHYDNDIDSCWDVAKSRIDATLKKRILGQYSYDVVDYINIDTTHENVTYKYVMLPVYIGNFNYKKKLFNFYVNGTSGKVLGKTPVSPWRVLFTVLLGLGVLVGIGALIYFYLLKG